MSNRAPEFEQRYQALLADRYKRHSPSKLRRFWEGEAEMFLRRAEFFRGKDPEKFARSIASVEKCWQTLDMLDELREAEEAA
jgi:hypothetical protein